MNIQNLHNDEFIRNLSEKYLGRYVKCKHCLYIFDDNLFNEVCIKCGKEFIKRYPIRGHLSGKIFEDILSLYEKRITKPIYVLVSALFESLTREFLIDSIRALIKPRSNSDNNWEIYHNLVEELVRRSKTIDLIKIIYGKNILSRDDKMKDFLKDYNNYIKPFRNKYVHGEPGKSDLVYNIEETQLKERIEELNNAIMEKEEYRYISGLFKDIMSERDILELYKLMEFSYKCMNFYVYLYQNYVSELYLK